MTLIAMGVLHDESSNSGHLPFQTIVIPHCLSHGKAKSITLLSAASPRRNRRIGRS
jgi:hypothetical protein